MSQVYRLKRSGAECYLRNAWAEGDTVRLAYDEAWDAAGVAFMMRVGDCGGVLQLVDRRDVEEVPHGR